MGMAKVSESVLGSMTVTVLELGLMSEWEKLLVSAMA